MGKTWQRTRTYDAGNQQTVRKFNRRFGRSLGHPFRTILLQWTQNVVVIVENSRNIFLGDFLDSMKKVSYSNSVVKLKNLNFKKNKYCNINSLFFKQINLPRNLNRIHLIFRPPLPDLNLSA